MFWRKKGMKICICKRWFHQHVGNSECWLQIWFLVETASQLSPKNSSKFSPIFALIRHPKCFAHYPCDALLRFFPVCLQWSKLEIYGQVKIGTFLVFYNARNGNNLIRWGNVCFHLRKLQFLVFFLHWLRWSSVMCHSQHWSINLWHISGIL